MESDPASSPRDDTTVLDLFPLGSDFPDWQAYGGFVEQPVAGSHVVAYDAAGAELGRSVDLRWPLSRSPGLDIDDL